MAGEWIKMRMELQSHPKVVRILSATGADKFRVIGGLHAVWCVFDQHSEDGKLVGYTPALMDHIIGWEGFSDAMLDVGWLAWDGADTMYMPEFSEHNGQSAKRRAEDQKRKRNARKRPQSVRNLSATEQDKKRTREEKRRYIKPPISPKGEELFERFWSTYPKKVGKDAARRAFAKRKPDESLLADILAALERQKHCTQWQRDNGQYIPNPATWLNQGRWQDGECEPESYAAGAI